MQTSCNCNVYHASKAQSDILQGLQQKKADADQCRETPNFVASVGKPFVALWKLVTGLLYPISDGVGRDVILLGQVPRAYVVLHHLPHDPSPLLRGEGSGADVGGRFHHRLGNLLIIASLLCCAAP